MKLRCQVARPRRFAGLLSEAYSAGWDADDRGRRISPARDLPWGLELDARFSS